MTQTSHPHRAFGYAALVVAALALILHLTAVMGAPATGMGGVFIVYPFGILAWGVLLHHTKRPMRGGWARDPMALIRPLPGWARVLFGAVFFYAILNFLLFFQATGGGTVERDANGQAVLSDHGRVIRTLDEQGAGAVEVWQVRAFSGHILPFLVLPGLYFVFASAGDDGEREREPAA